MTYLTNKKTPLFFASKDDIKDLGPDDKTKSKKSDLTVIPETVFYDSVFTRFPRRPQKIDAKRYQPSDDLAAISECHSPRKN